MPGGVAGAQSIMIAPYADPTGLGSCGSGGSVADCGDGGSGR